MDEPQAPQEVPAPSPVPPVAPPQLQEAFGSTTRQEKFIEHRGTVQGQEYDKVRLVMNPRVRHMRNKCFEDGSLAFAMQNGGKKGFYFTVAEKTYATLRIQSWSYHRVADDKWIAFPGSVGDMWEYLDEDLGDKLSDAIELKEVMQKIADQLKGKGVQEAKNS